MQKDFRVRFDFEVPAEFELADAVARGIRSFQEEDEIYIADKTYNMSNIRPDEVRIQCEFNYYAMQIFGLVDIGEEIVSKQ